MQRLTRIFTDVKALALPPRTKNFNLETDPKLACTCGHELCDKRAVKQSILNRLQKVRDDYELPMMVTSGGRCPWHDCEVGRLEPADHQKCQGVDIAISSKSDAMRLQSIATLHGFNAFGINEKTWFIHLGYRPELKKGKFATWTY